MGRIRTGGGMDEPGVRWLRIRGRWELQALTRMVKDGV